MRKVRFSYTRWQYPDEVAKGAVISVEEIDQFEAAYPNKIGLFKSYFVNIGGIEFQVTLDQAKEYLATGKLRQEAKV